MAVINTGKLPLIKDVVNKILIEDGGIKLYFESGATIFGHSYTTERQYDNSPNNICQVGPEKDSQNDYSCK